MSATEQLSLPKRLARFFAKSVFLPSDMRYDLILSPFFRVVVVGSLGTLVILNCPPVSKFVGPYLVDPGTEAAIKASASSVKLWLDFLQTIFEVLTIIALGGGVFTEWATRGSQKTIAEIQDALDRSSTTQIKESSEQLTQYLDSIIDAYTTATWRNLGEQIRTIASASASVTAIMYYDVRFVNAKFLMARFWANFPGGLYGLIAFFAALAVLALKACKTYVEVISGGA